MVIDKDSLIKYLELNGIEFNEKTWKSAFDYSKKYELKKGKSSNKDTSLPSNIEQLILKRTIGQYFKLQNIGGDFKAKEINQVNNELSSDIDNELKIKWGSTYLIEEYLKLEDFYFKMKDFNKIETPQDEFYLKKLAVISLKMDIELEKGNYSQVKQLGDLFSKYMGDSKFRAMDLTDATKTGGLRTFSHIYAEVERDDFIPPWEQYRIEKNLEQDIVDKTIMYILNYTLKLNKISQMITPPDDTPKVDG